MITHGLVDLTTGAVVELCAIPEWAKSCHPRDLEDLTWSGRDGLGLFPIRQEEPDRSLGRWTEVDPVFDGTEKMVQRRWTMRAFTAAEAAARAERAAQSVLAEVEKEVQERLDAWARERQYRHCDALCSYDGDPNPVFAAEGARGKAMRSEMWRACYAIMQDVRDGKRHLPSAAEVLAGLPALTWD